MKLRILIGCMALVTLGAGPCDMLMSEEAMTADGGPDCDPSTCTSALSVSIIRADNQSFGAGFYTFTMEFQDASSVGVECYLGHVETGLQCTAGATHLLTALLGLDGTTIQLILLGAPAWTLVTIDYNNYRIGRRALSPVYSGDSADRVSCSQHCVYAQEAMAVESW